MDKTHSNDGRSPRAKWIFLGFASVAAIALGFEHGLHLVPYLPWLLVLACPLLHVFHHHGHGRRHHERENTP